MKDHSIFPKTIWPKIEDFFRIFFQGSIFLYEGTMWPSYVDFYEYLLQDPLTNKRWPLRIFLKTPRVIDSNSYKVGIHSPGQIWEYFCKAHTRGILLFNFLRNQKIKIFKNIFSGTNLIQSENFLEYFFNDTILFLIWPSYLNFWEYLLRTLWPKSVEVWEYFTKKKPRATKANH